MHIPVISRTSLNRQIGRMTRPPLSHRVFDSFLDAVDFWLVVIAQMLKTKSGTAFLLVYGLIFGMAIVVDIAVLLTFAIRYWFHTGLAAVIISALVWHVRDGNKDIRKVDAYARRNETRDAELEIVKWWASEKYRELQARPSWPHEFQREAA